MIQILNKLLNRSQLSKFNPSWHLASKLELLEANLDYTSIIVTHHVRREAKKLVDMLANWGINNPMEKCNQAWEDAKRDTLE